MTDSPQQEPAVPGSLSRRIGALLARITPPPNWSALPVCVLLGTVCAIVRGVFAAPQYAAVSHVVAVSDADVQPGAAPGFSRGTPPAVPVPAGERELV
ncbi:hypothetical protein [Streptomyces sp. NPDC005283]|uniref:hypothetical protein n=1 Tax=Streptomyces sp. NPDC005283 TaxID=3156871 RepID=UPI003453AEA3